MTKIKLTVWERLFLIEFIESSNPEPNSLDDVEIGMAMIENLRIKDRDFVALGGVPKSENEWRIKEPMLDADTEIRYNQEGFKWLCDRFLNPTLRGFPMDARLPALRKKLKALGGNDEPAE
jgi:hypothetical protein